MWDPIHSNVQWFCQESAPMLWAPFILLYGMIKLLYFLRRSNYSIMHNKKGEILKFFFLFSYVYIHGIQSCGFFSEIYESPQEDMFVRSQSFSWNRRDLDRLFPFCQEKWFVFQNSEPFFTVLCWHDEHMLKNVCVHNYTLCQQAMFYVTVCIGTGKGLFCCIFPSCERWLRKLNRLWGTMGTNALHESW